MDVVVTAVTAHAAPSITTETALVELPKLVPAMVTVSLPGGLMNPIDEVLVVSEAPFGVVILEMLGVKLD